MEIIINMEDNNHQHNLLAKYYRKLAQFLLVMDPKQQ